MSALAAFKVLELSENVSGEYCGKLLSDFGAHVIKIEKPGCGSPTRRLGPFARGDVKNAGENSGLFAYLNTNKHSVALDLSSADGLATLGRLLQCVDVVIDDHADGWLRSIGLDPATCCESHPQLVLCAITAYGQTPPADRKHAEDLNVFHSSGWGFHTGGASGAANEELPPLKGAGRFLVSYEAGMDAAMCIVAALYEREASKQGRFIDISKHQVMASRIDYVLGQMVAGDMDVTPQRTAFDLAGPAGIFRCRDGFAYIWMSTPAHWEALRKLLGNPQWMNDFPEHWMERECTPERVATCRQHLAVWLQTQGKADAAVAAQKLGLTLVPVNNARDLKASPQYLFRGYFADVNHPVLGHASYPTVPYKLSVTPARIVAPAPLLGQHTHVKLNDHE